MSIGNVYKPKFIDQPYFWTQKFKDNRYSKSKSFSEACVNGMNCAVTYFDSFCVRSSNITNLFINVCPNTYILQNNTKGE